MELGGALRNTEYMMSRSFMCHIRPLWGLGFLRGALIQPQNQRVPLTKIRYPRSSGAPLPKEGG